MHKAELTPQATEIPVLIFPVQYQDELHQPEGLVIGHLNDVNHMVPEYDFDIETRRSLNPLISDTTLRVRTRLEWLTEKYANLDADDFCFYLVLAKTPVNAAQNVQYIHHQPDYTPKLLTRPEVIGTFQVNKLGVYNLYLLCIDAGPLLD